MFQIRTSSNILILKIDQPGRVWKRVIKQKHPGAISLQNKNEGNHKLISESLLIEIEKNNQELPVNFPPPGGQLVTTSI